jgi:hypothetical protein
MGKNPRIAIVGSPRSGNTWLMHLLSKSYDVPALPISDPRTIDWQTLPAACVIQFHWHHTNQFTSQLTQHRFQVVSLARHPFDVLISVLQFCQYEPTAHWLAGEGGSERQLDGGMPCSRAFEEYASGSRAAVLLSITPQWWSAPGCRQLRYEDLVSNPEHELKNLLNWLGPEPALPPCEAIAETTIPKLRRQTGNVHHFWKGRPGLWRSLLPMPNAFRILPLMRNNIRDFGYRFDPDPSLTLWAANLNWMRLIGCDCLDARPKSAA